MPGYVCMKNRPISFIGRRAKRGYALRLQLWYTAATLAAAEMDARKPVSLVTITTLTEIKLLKKMSADRTRHTVRNDLLINYTLRFR